jgi:hypothetical protein
MDSYRMNGDIDNIPECIVVHCKNFICISPRPRSEKRGYLLEKDAPERSHPPMPLRLDITVKP